MTFPIILITVGLAGLVLAGDKALFAIAVLVTAYGLAPELIDVGRQAIKRNSRD